MTAAEHTRDFQRNDEILDSNSWNKNEVLHLIRNTYMEYLSYLQAERGGEQ